MVTNRLRWKRPTTSAASGRVARGLAVSFLAAVCSFAAAGAASAETGSAAVPATAVVISGHGFGHGIGLSQWGAEERAAAGQTYDEILSFYYPGTELRTVPSTNVRVWLTEQPRLQIGSRSPFTVEDAAGRAVRLPGGIYPVDGTGLLATTRIRLPLVAKPGTAPLQLGGTRYHGTLSISLNEGKLEAVNALALDDYVVDVVSSECPGYWPKEALRAQAVASRSYALTSIRTDATFDVYPDDRSQNYHGMRKEFPSAAAAVSATRQQVLFYAGQPVKAFFSASNGGLTSGVEDIWGAPHLPYFISREDTFDAQSPDRNWGPVTLEVDQLHAAFPELPARLMNVTIARNTAGRVSTVTFVGADGSQLQIDGYTFQQRLGLRSTYLSLTPTYPAPSS
jgi:stage II sporulation protein D